MVLGLAKAIFFLTKKKESQNFCDAGSFAPSMMAPLFAAPCAAARINEENKSKGVSCHSVVVSTCQISEHGGDALLSVLHARVSCFTTEGGQPK